MSAAWETYIDLWRGGDFSFEDVVLDSMNGGIHLFLGGDREMEERCALLCSSFPYRQEA
jgi:hypothetical protein